MMSTRFWEPEPKNDLKRHGLNSIRTPPVIVFMWRISFDHGVLVKSIPAIVVLRSSRSMLEGNFNGKMLKWMKKAWISYLERKIFLTSVFSSCRTSAYPQVPPLQPKIADMSRLNRPGGQSRSKRIPCGRGWRCDWGQGPQNEKCSKYKKGSRGPNNIWGSSPLTRWSSSFPGSGPLPVEQYMYIQL